jgi:hypothetical protein
MLQNGCGVNKLFFNFRKNMKKITQISGIIIGMTAMAMAWIMYDWKLMLIILLALWGNNMEQRGRE